jgi:AraC-like DNA-binding protein
LDGIAVSGEDYAWRAEWAQYLRPSALPGTEVLHARFVSHRYVEHIHDAWTIATVDDGAARFALRDTQYVASAGSVFIIPPGAVHTGEPATPVGYSYRVLYIGLEESPCVGLEPLPERTTNRRLPIVFRDQLLSCHLARLHNSIQLPGRRLEQSETLQAVLADLANISAATAVTEQPTEVTGSVGRAVDYIRQHWSEDFTLTDLAQNVGASRYHLVRSFHRHLGVTPSGYRRALRVTAAQRLLRHGQSPMTVAGECGFYDQAHLNRHFKRATGVTPGQYMRAETSS